MRVDLLAGMKRERDGVGREHELLLEPEHVQCRRALRGVEGAQRLDLL
jgi:hypothetical protein